MLFVDILVYIVAGILQKIFQTRVLPFIIGINRHLIVWGHTFFVLSYSQSFINTKLQSTMLQLSFRQVASRFYKIFLKCSVYIVFNLPQKFLKMQFLQKHI